MGKIVQNKRIILASTSPRRQNLMTELDLDFKIKIKEVDEVYPRDTLTHKIPEFLSVQKAAPFLGQIPDHEIVITADTLVIDNDKVLGKPKDSDEAKLMLKMLSGKSHSVITGVTISESEKQHTFSVESKVYFKELSELEIEYYIDKFQPLDKAGSYGIQEWIGYIGIQKIDGCFYNVMGLPLNALWSKLLELGILELEK